MYRAARIIKTVIYGFLLLPHQVNASSPAGWDGEYVYEGVYGNTYGGSPVIEEYTVRVGKFSEWGCDISIAGFQTDETIICEAKAEGNSLTLTFTSYDSGEDVNAYGVKIYKPGQPLLRFERSKKNGKSVLVTRWPGITDPYDHHPEPGIYFKRYGR